MAPQGLGLGALSSFYFGMMLNLLVRGESQPFTRTLGASNRPGTPSSRMPVPKNTCHLLVLTQTGGRSDN